MYFCLLSCYMHFVLKKIKKKIQKRDFEKKKKKEKIFQKKSEIFFFSKKKKNFQNFFWTRSIGPSL